MDTCESSYQDNVYEVHFEENPEEYMEVISAIKNAEIMFLGAIVHFGMIFDSMIHNLKLI